jgi:hypothetical protein
MDKIFCSLIFTPFLSVSLLVCCGGSCNWTKWVLHEIHEVQLLRERIFVFIVMFFYNTGKKFVIKGKFNQTPKLNRRLCLNNTASTRHIST